MSDPVLQIALDLTSGLTAHDRYRRLLATMRRIMPSDAAMLMRFEDGVLTPVVFDGLRDDVKRMRFPVADFPVFAHIVASPGVVRVVGGEIRNFRFYAQDSEAGDRPMGILIGAALRVEDEVVGTLTTSAVDPRAFDEVEDETVTTFAALAAVAFRTAQLIEQLEVSAERRREVAQELQRDAAERVLGPLLGESEAVRRLREQVDEQAANEETVLLAGPPGAGREAVARAIHDRSSRAERAFIYVNCAQMESEEDATLLGSARSYLTRVEEPKTGKFDLADGGTLFLQGVDQLSGAMQRELRAVLQVFDEVRGRGESPKPDVRVVATTSFNPEASPAGGFDQELFRLLTRRRITLPPLADRKEDLPALVAHFLRLHARRIGKSVTNVSTESLAHLSAYAWPGNIQELSNVLERAVVTARGSVVEISASSLDEGIPVGSYRLMEKLGEGGMGEVWRARHQLLARPAAVKLIRRDALRDSGNERLVERFHREAAATAMLRSPHTVELFDFGIAETGDFYYVMELLDGADLQSLVQRTGPLPPERVVALLSQACRSLAEAHEAGMVHRDVKPANLFVCQLGLDLDFLKVLDFGMVKDLGRGDETRLTMEGTAQGTPAFIAPEMALGDVEVDARADLYSLGCVAFWLLTGQLVFEASSQTRMLLHHIQTEPGPPSALAEHDIPGELDDLVLACLRKSPAERPPSAREVWRALEAIPLETPWTTERAEQWWRLHLPESVSR